MADKQPSKKRRPRQWRPGGGLVPIWNIDRRFMSADIDTTALRAECAALNQEIEDLGLNTVASCTKSPVYAGSSDQPEGMGCCQ